MRRAPEFVWPAGLAAIFGLYWAVCSLLIHRSFHSSGWDLGIFTQLVWNTAHGQPFEYSFRNISYAGDHWQPALLLFVPLSGTGAEGLLWAQAAVLAAAVVPLWYLVRRHADALTAGLVSAAYGLSLGVARAVSFDFHLEALAPLLCFTALLGLSTKRDIVVYAAMAGLLAMKEDGFLLVLGLMWVAMLFYGWRRRAAAVGAVALIYAVIANVVLMPHFRGNDSNPLKERYGYLGDSALDVLLGIPLHPTAVAEHVVTVDTLGVVVILVVASAFTLVLQPRFLPAMVGIIALQVLSDDKRQADFELHYLLVAATFALCCYLVYQDTRNRQPFAHRLPPRRHAAILLVGSAALFALVSPLPPGLSTRYARFDVDHHAAVGESFVDDTPEGVIVSAQSPLVPHIADRREVFNFPRIERARYVLVDRYGPVPVNDVASGYQACLDGLPQLGFRLLRAEDGLELWERDSGAEIHNCLEALGQTSGQG